MNQEERSRLRKHLRIEKAKKGRPLTKEELSNIYQGYIFSHQKKAVSNFKPTLQEPTSIGDLLTKFKGEQHD